MVLKAAIVWLVNIDLLAAAIWSQSSGKIWIEIYYFQCPWSSSWHATLGLKITRFYKRYEMLCPADVFGFNISIVFNYPVSLKGLLLNLNYVFSFMEPIHICVYRW